MKTTSIIITLLFVFLFGSCNSGKTWEQVKEENNPEAYLEFLKNNPETEHKDSIELLIFELDWISAKSKNTAEALDFFLEKYPESKEYIDSINDIKSDLTWEVLSNSTDIEAYKKFVKKFPSSQYKSDAKLKIENLKWENVKKINKKIDYIAFFSEYKFKRYCDSIKSLGVMFSASDFKGFNISFVYDSEEQEDEGNTYENIKINFRKNGKFDGIIEGFQEGENYSNAWNENVKGEYDQFGFDFVQSQMEEQSDAYYEGEPEPEPWEDCNLVYDENAIYYKDRWYFIKEISETID